LRNLLIISPFAFVSFSLRYLSFLLRKVFSVYQVLLFRVNICHFAFPLSINFYTLLILSHSLKTHTHTHKHTLKHTHKKSIYLLFYASEIDSLFQRNFLKQSPMTSKIAFGLPLETILKLCTILFILYFIKSTAYKKHVVNKHI